MSEQYFWDTLDDCITRENTGTYLLRGTAAGIYKEFYKVSENTFICFTHSDSQPTEFINTSRELFLKKHGAQVTKLVEFMIPSNVYDDLVNELISLEECNTTNDTTEYIDKSKIPFVYVDNPKGEYWTRMVLEKDIEAIKPADVVERAEYNKLKEKLDKIKEVLDNRCTGEHVTAIHKIEEIIGVDYIEKGDGE